MRDVIYECPFGQTQEFMSMGKMLKKRLKLPWIVAIHLVDVIHLVHLVIVHVYSTVGIIHLK